MALYHGALSGSLGSCNQPLLPKNWFILQVFCFRGKAGIFPVRKVMEAKIFVSS